MPRFRTDPRSRSSNFNLSAQETQSLSVCKFSLLCPYKKSCVVLRIKQIIIFNNLSKMKIEILPNCLQGNYRGSLGEFSNTLSGVFGAVKGLTRF